MAAAAHPTPEAGGFVGAPGSGAVSHVFPVRVYYEDTDFSGVVYYARYLHFFERGRTEFLRAAGVSHQALLEGEDPSVFAVRRLNVSYERAARVDDVLAVRTRFAPLAGARLPIRQEITRDDALVAAADVEVVCLTTGGRPKRAPAVVSAALAPYVTPISR